MKRITQRRIKKAIARVRKQLGLQGGTVTMTDYGNVHVQGGRVTRTEILPCEGSVGWPLAHRESHRR